MPWRRERRISRRRTSEIARIENRALLRLTRRARSRNGVVNKTGGGFIIVAATSNAVGVRALDDAIRR